MFGLKRRQYTDQQLAFLEELRNPENEGDLRKCKDAAGYDKSHSIAKVISSLHEEIVTIAREMMASNAVKAAWALTQGIENPDPMTPIRTQNAERILDRVGLGKGEKIQIDSGPSRIAILPARRVDAS